jgi:hypothetical protein
MGIFSFFKRRSRENNRSEQPKRSEESTAEEPVKKLQRNDFSEGPERVRESKLPKTPVTKLPENGLPKVSEMNYHQYGAKCAIDTQCNPEILPATLGSVYNKFLVDTKMDAEAIQSRISKLETEVLQKKSQKERLLGETGLLETQKENKEKRIEDLRIEKISLTENHASFTDWTPLIIGSFILIILTLFLYAFYCSLIYSLFFGTEVNNVSFFNPNVFSDTKNKGGLTSWVIFCSPIIVLSIGYLIHTFLSQKRYLYLFSLLLLMLVIDSLISYQITKSIYENRFSAGMTDEKWKVAMAINDPQFWTVILLGYVMYIVWGVLLHNVLRQYSKLQPDKILELKTENLEKRILETEESLNETRNKLTELTSAVTILNNEIDLKNNDIIGYRNGIIPIKVSALRDAVAQFMNGWYAQTNLLMGPANAKPVTERAARVQTEWLEEKIKNLDSDH